MQRRLIVPVILHCQCVDESVSEETLRDVVPRSPLSSQFLSDVSLHHRVLSAHTSSNTVSSALPEETSARVPENSALRNSIYTPVSARMDEGSHFAAVPLLTSESSTSLSSEIRNYELMERKTLFARCLPLMKDHYCVDEICYKLGISHASFWRMVEDLPDHFCVFYVIPDLWRVCWLSVQANPILAKTNRFLQNKHGTPKDGKRGWNQTDSRWTA